MVVVENSNTHFILKANDQTQVTIPTFQFSNESSHTAILQSIYCEPNYLVFHKVEFYKYMSM